jgi:hypothetical protein
MSAHNSPLLKDITGATFRANPDYELVLFDRLPPEQQVLLANLQKDSDLYGILCPRQASGLGVKSVGKDTALLYFTLQQPDVLPAYLRAQFGEECNQAIAELVLDGVLEIEQGAEKGGTFVSGSDAYGLLYEERESANAPGVLARLSIEALKYAQALEIDDISKLSARMYFYNRVPASPDWVRRLPTREAVAKHLGIHQGGPNWHILRQDWSEVPLTLPYAAGWRMWQGRHRDLKLASPRITYKLYVSPACESASDVFAETLQVLTQVKASKFKIGEDVYGLLRPDKIVAYFASFEELQDAAWRLRDKLGGCSAHGVPFTAELAANGLLSWGMDPPHEQQVLLWQERQSWRLWLTNRLAVALISAKGKQSGTIEPWQFAMQRLELEGVDTATWTPKIDVLEEDWLYGEG